MNVKLIVLLAVVVNCALCGVVENQRPKRTLHYFFEGLLSALSEKHRSSSLSEENTAFLPFGLSKHKFMGASSNSKSVGKPLVQAPIPLDKPKPTIGTLNLIANGPTKVVLPLIISKTTTVIPKSTTAASPETIATTAVAATTTGATTATTSITTTEPPTTSTTTTEPPTTSTTTSSTTTSSSESTSTDTTSTETTSTDADQTTSTPNTEPCDDTTIDTTTPLSNEIEPKADTNITTINTIGVQKLPLLPLRAPLLNSGRHTQFFGNPLIIQPHNTYLPSYYREDEYENSVEQNHNAQATYRGPKYLPPVSSQLIVLPMAVPFQLPTAGPTPLVDERNPQHSRIKMHDSDYNHYINHGTGQLHVPVVHLHQAHIQYFGHRSQKV